MPRAALDRSPDDRTWYLAGELCDRRGDFAGARRAFDHAVALNPEYPRAWWGLGRVELLYFRRDSARDFFIAYPLNPRDPEILLSYLEFVDYPAARTTLLQNVVTVSRASDPAIAERALIRLRIEASLGGRRPGALAAPYAAYSIPLAGFRPGGAASHGWIVNARINGSRPLRLVLDTGARGMMLYRKTARGLALKPLATTEVGGFGTDGPADSTLALARSVALGALKLPDCLIEVGGEAPRDPTVSWDSPSSSVSWCESIPAPGCWS